MVLFENRVNETIPGQTDEQKKQTHLNYLDKYNERRRNLSREKKDQRNKQQRLYRATKFNSL